MYTTVAVLVPSTTEAVVAELITGATSVTDRLTACVEVSVPSLAVTLKLYELFVS